MTRIAFREGSQKRWERRGRNIKRRGASKFTAVLQRRYAIMGGQAVLISSNALRISGKRTRVGELRNLVPSKGRQTVSFPYSRNNAVC